MKEGTRRNKEISFNYPLLREYLRDPLSHTKRHLLCGEGEVHFIYNNEKFCSPFHEVRKKEQALKECVRILHRSHLKYNNVVRQTSGEK